MRRGNPNHPAAAAATTTATVLSAEAQPSDGAEAGAAAATVHAAVQDEADAAAVEAWPRPKQRLMPKLRAPELLGKPKKPRLRPLLRQRRHSWLRRRSRRRWARPRDCGGAGGPETYRKQNDRVFVFVQRFIVFEGTTPRGLRPSCSATAACSRSSSCAELRKPLL